MCRLLCSIVCFQTGLCCISSDEFPWLVLNNCRNCVDILRSNNCWPETNMSVMIIRHATCPFEFGKQPADGFRNGSFCDIKSSLKTALCARDTVYQPVIFTIKINTYLHPFYSVGAILFTFQWFSFLARQLISRHHARNSLLTPRYNAVIC